jgi:GWxTD domain-containing protein
LTKAAFLAAVILLARASRAQTWLDLVSPILSQDERKAYLVLAPEAREKFEQAFWEDKAIAADDYFRRVSYVDANFGSGRPGSGANTDQGCVYLSLGAPNGITRLPSSKYFVPLEIWNYASVPRLGISSELRLIFFQKNSRGLYKLYSPSVDTIRALLVPQAGLLGMFGPNDEISEADIRTRLNSTPAEDEIIPAAVSVSPGIKGLGNQEVLGRVLSPRTMLHRDLKPLVQSTFSVWRPKMDVLFSRSKFGGVQVDIAFEVQAQREISFQVLEGPATVFTNVVSLKFESQSPVQYLHRLDLLPGEYRAVIGVDGKQYPLPLNVPPQAGASEIVRVAEARPTDAVATPWEHDGRRFYPLRDGKFAVMAIAQPGDVTWTLRRGYEILSRQKTAAASSAILALPIDSLTPGRYQLEARIGTDTRQLEFDVEKRTAVEPAATLVSYNANLSPAARLAFVGHQHLLRGDAADALPSLRAALPLKEAQIGLARIDAVSSRYDEARARLQPLLAADPNDFDGLSVMAYIEAKLQDYEVAAAYYRRALAVRDSPALRTALASLPF